MKLLSGFAIIDFDVRKKIRFVFGQFCLSVFEEGMSHALWVMGV